ncbi:uncharacterized protein LOC143253324 [Tachypleus tridentatus]|uniref:uncharacterized protein LOC143253324 n=1 Tax=Tachypleus tridentatus TaxID=6853 RepID=UPI003FCF6AC8
MKTLDQMFEGVADFVGKVPVEGPLTELTLQRCLKTLPLFSHDQSLKHSTQDNTWRVRFDGQCLTASNNKPNSLEIEKMDLENVVLCYLPRDSSRSVVWVVRNGTRKETKEAWVWRCAVEKDAIQLYHMYHEVIEKRRYGSDSVHCVKNSVKKNFTDELSAIVAEGLNLKKCGELPKTVRPEGCPHIRINLISQSEEKDEITSDQNQEFTTSTKNLEFNKNSSVQAVKEKPKVPPRTRRKAPPPRPPRKATKQISKPSQPKDTFKAHNSPGCVQQQLSSNVKEDKGSIKASSEEVKNVTNREVLVAVSRSCRDRKPVSTRQREPAKLLASRPEETPWESKISRGTSPHRPAGGASLGTLVKNLLGADSSNHSRTEGVKSFENHYNRQRSRSTVPSTPGWSAAEDYCVLEKSWKDGDNNRKSSDVLAVPYTKWITEAGSGDPQINSGLLRKVFGNKPTNGSKNLTSNEIPSPVSHLDLLEGFHTFSKSLNPNKSKFVGFQSQPSGSLTSDESDSGTETKPKSVLKKPSSSVDGLHESKKNVTFNTMTTVQVMEE